MTERKVALQGNSAACDPEPVATMTKVEGVHAALEVFSGPRRTDREVTLKRANLGAVLGKEMRARHPKRDVVRRVNMAAMIDKAMPRPTLEYRTLDSVRLTPGRPNPIVKVKYIAADGVGIAAGNQLSVYVTPGSGRYGVGPGSAELLESHRIDLDPPSTMDYQYMPAARDILRYGRTQHDIAAEITHRD